jgi:NhaP-type Na+/H+ or K+/H+ antiporter
MGYAPALIALVFVAFALVSRRLDRSPLTGTLLFTAFGLLIGPEVLGIADLTGLVGQSEVVNLAFVATLVIVLFTDASAINSAAWREDVIPARLLGIGLPVMVAVGWLGAMLVVDGLEVWEAAVLAAMLAPTDAALGKAVVANPRVPHRIRQALSVESGLNDGIALPVFVVFLEAAIVVEEGLPAGELLTELFRQVGVAVTVGVAVGWLGAWAIAEARRRRTAEALWLQIAVVALAGGAYALAVPLGGSGFIAAWCAGFLFGRGSRRAAAGDDAASTTVHEFAEATGTWLTMASFVLFGIYLGPVLTDLTWPVVVYGILSLAVFRLLSVVVATIGAGLDRSSVMYLGWFGPRGLATLILSIEVAEVAELDGGGTIVDAALFAVGLSVLAHGLTAWWGSNAYADRIARHPEAGSLEEDARPAAVRPPRRFEQPVD